MFAQLPSNPYNGQIWTDGTGVRWQWSSERGVWASIGTTGTIPLADVNTVGLMSPQDKRLLDSVPVVAGSFGIITNQAAIIQSSENRAGLISGRINLHSDSLDIECVDALGKPYLGQVLQDSVGMDMPGLKFSLSDEFLNSLCLEISGPAGPKGDKGPVGDAGRDGFSNGPAGEKGDPGSDATVAYTFSGIKVIESDEITDTAVVAMEMDGKSGRLSYTTAKMNVPSNTEPADQLLAVPIQRSVIYPVVAEGGNDYVTLDDWQLQIPPGDALPGDPEVLLVKMPDGIEVGDTSLIELVKLTDFISVVVQSYKDKLSSFQDVWMAQMKEYVESKDATARRALSTVAQQLAQCEFSRPLSFCLGISPSDCTEAVTGGATPPQGVALGQIPQAPPSGGNGGNGGPSPSPAPGGGNGGLGYGEEISGCSGWTISYSPENGNFQITNPTSKIKWAGHFDRGSRWEPNISGYGSLTASPSGEEIVMSISVAPQGYPLIYWVNGTYVLCRAAVQGSVYSQIAWNRNSTDVLYSPSSKVVVKSISETETPVTFDPTDPTKCLQPYKLALIVITDKANPVYVTGISDAELDVVNYYYNDRAGWEQFINELNSNQAVALGLLQIPNTDDRYFGDQRDVICAESTLPYDSLNSATFYELLPEQSPKITSSNIVSFIQNMLDVQYGGGDFVPDQINVLFKLKALSGDDTNASAERTALNNAIVELKRTYPSTCFVSAVTSSSSDHNQDDRWLLDATATARQYMCYHSPETAIPGQDHTVILCITDEASPIYSYAGYNGPDGENGPIGIPKNMTAWDFDRAKWNDILAALQGSNNKIRLGILQPQGYAGSSPLGGDLKPSNRTWPGDTDRNIITVTQTKKPSFTSDDILVAFQTITNNNDYAATILYVVVDTSGSLGDPNMVSNIVESGISAIKLKYSDVIVLTDVVDVGSNKEGELASPPSMEGYTVQIAPEAYLWGWEYASADGRNSILFPSLYVRSTIDAAERWLGRAAGIGEQLLSHWSS